MGRLRCSADVDGCRVDYLELGDGAGRPVLYLHGTPSSGCEAGWLDAAARAHGVRLVAPDRPGYLGSGLPPDRTLLGTAGHLVAFARWLELGSFGVAAFSGGAAFALAVAYLAPEVTGVQIGGGLCGSIDELPRSKRALFRLSAASPLSIGLTMRMLRRILRKRFAESPAAAAHELFKDAAKGAQVPAYEAYIRDADPADLRDELASYITAAGSTAGVMNDLRAFVTPWGFELRDVDVPVGLWHGAEDPAVAPSSAERAAQQLPQGRMHLLDGEGHFVFLAHADEVVGALRGARHEAPQATATVA